MRSVVSALATMTRYVFLTAVLYEQGQMQMTAIFLSPYCTTRKQLNHKRYHNRVSKTKALQKEANLKQLEA